MNPKACIPFITGLMIIIAIMFTLLIYMSKKRNDKKVEMFYGGGALVDASKIILEPVTV